MLQDLFETLKAEWENLHTATNDWIAQLEGKYSEGSDADTKAVRESISNKKFALTNTHQSLQQANPTTHAGIRELAGKAQNYLDMTESIHQSLTQHSAGDAQTEEAAAAVQKYRGTLSDHVQTIYSSTIVHGASPTIPLMAGGNIAAYADSPGDDIALPGTAHADIAYGDRSAGSLAAHSPGPSSGGVSSRFMQSKPDNQFVCLLKQLYSAESVVVIQTEKLFRRERMTLRDRQIGKLLESWGKVTAALVDSSQTSKLNLLQCHAKDNDTPTTTPSEIDFFSMHRLLEELYDRLETYVTRTDEDIDILSPNI